MNLYNLSSRYEQLLDQEEYTNEELKELYSLHESVEDECIDRGKYIGNLEAELVAVSDAIMKMSERHQLLKKRIDRHRFNLADKMLKCNITKITKSPLFPIKLKKNPAKLIEYNSNFIPEKYYCEIQPPVVKKLDKVAIKQDIESGIEVPGCGLESSYRIEFK